MTKQEDKYRGCLIGGAIGDALGYAIEFQSEATIFNRYGEKGITDYELCAGKALISDDTQMALFTAEGLLHGTAQGAKSVKEYVKHIDESYKDWYQTQVQPSPSEDAKEGLMRLRDLYARRAPGNTCLSAISDSRYGTIEHPINNSKGCGTVMRVAPIGLYFGDKMSIDEINQIAAESSALTHGHALGYIPSAALVHMIHIVSHTNADLMEATLSMREKMLQMYAENPFIDYFIELVDRAIELSKQPVNVLDAIHQLGEGWVAEEAFVIALYCALKYPNDFEKAVVASVNHKGDSDSTGAVLGNLLGAYLGISQIPEKYLTNLELRDAIIEMADQLIS